MNRCYNTQCQGNSPVDMAFTLADGTHFLCDDAMCRELADDSGATNYRMADEITSAPAAAQVVTIPVIDQTTGRIVAKPTKPRRDTFGFVGHMWDRELANALRRQMAAFKTAHSACAHAVTLTESIDCAHTAALAYTPGMPTAVGDVLRVVKGDRAGSTVTIERVMSDGYGVAFADGFRTWIDARHVAA